MPKIPLTVSIEENLRYRLRKHQGLTGFSMSTIVSIALMQVLPKEQPIEKIIVPEPIKTKKSYCGMCKHQYDPKVAITCPKCGAVGVIEK